MEVRIQVPAFHEGFAYAATLEAIREQDVPATVDVEREVWVTPSCPDLESCRTWLTATNTQGWSAEIAPVGKLSARNAAHDAAVREGADVIVAWDADAPPRDDQVLAALLEPFAEPDVVATNGTPVAPPSPIGVLVNLASTIEDALRPQMHGQLSAFTAQAWQASGGFSTADVDESSVASVRRVEEFGFRRALAEQGRVVDVADAAVFNDTRRYRCMVHGGFAAFGSTPNPACERRALQAMSPRYQRHRLER